MVLGVPVLKHFSVNLTLKKFKGKNKEAMVDLLFIYHFVACLDLHIIFSALSARPCGALGSASDSRARGPGFDTWSGHICFSFR